MGSGGAMEGAMGGYGPWGSSGILWGGSEVLWGGSGALGPGEALGF